MIHLIGPTIELIFAVIILIYAILIYKENSYRYGLFLAIFSIISIISEIIYISIDYPNLAYRLNVVEMIPLQIVSTILFIWSTIFLILGICSSLFLVLAVYMIYMTHKPKRKL
jgi:hypothetical protein